MARSDYDILYDLADRMDCLAEFSEGRSASQWIQLFLDHSDVPDQEGFRRKGIYLAPEQERVGLSAFSEDPSGHPLGTPSGKVELASERYERETRFPAIPIWQRPPQDDRHPLLLITPKSSQRTHSQGGQAPVAGHALEIHPQDADLRRISEGDTVRLFNARGQALITAHVSGDLAPGVVSLLEGVWVDLDDDGVDRAGSANLFMSTEGTAPSKACIMNAIPVEVRRVEPPGPSPRDSRTLN
jgi:anaerobic selenocysteine-containing dehydrogenase